MSDVYTDWLFKLLHDRDARTRFVRGDLGSLPEDLRAEFDVIDRKDLERSAQKTILTVHSILKRAFPTVFAGWARVFPEDPHAFDLVHGYLASSEYESATNFALKASDVSLLVAFPQYLQGLLDADPERYESILD